MIKLQKPKDTISNEMIASIPRKVYMWVRHLEKISKKELISENGSFSYSGLHAIFKDDGGSLTVNGKFAAEAILWEGLAVAPTEISVAKEWMADVSKNLDSFIYIEQQVYGALERLEKEITDGILQASATNAV